MADKKISELDAITGANTAATDVFVVVDTSTGQTKKITREELNNAIEQDVLSSIDIDTINGDFTVNGNINLGDDDKAIFGAGSDLEIYHDGSNSYVKDAGTGNLLIQADNFVVLETTAGVNYFQGQSGGASTIYHSGNPKLDTTSTGIDVTGTVTADGLTVANTGLPTITIQDQDGTNQRAFFRQSASTTIITSQDGTSYGQFLVSAYNGTNTINRFRVSSGGDISFYEDTGTTAKLFWDASAERLGIGTTSPTQKLTVTNGYGIFEGIKVGQNGTDIDSTFLGANSLLAFKINGTESMRITSSGNVGIGTTSPDSIVTIDKDVSTAYSATDDAAQRSNTNTLLLKNEDGTANSFAQIAFDLASSNQSIARIVGINDGTSTSALAFVTEGNNTKREVMRLDGSGNVGIGTDSPSANLHISDPNPVIRLDESDQTNHRGLIQFNSNALRIRARANTARGGIRFEGDNGTDIVEYARFNNQGYLGIGASSPDSALMVTDDSNYKVRIGFNGTSQNIYDANENVFRAANGTEIGRFKSNGRVGIGTSSPQAITEIVGSNAGGALDVLNLRNAGGDGSEVAINMISSTDQNNTAARSFIKSIRSGSNPHLTFGTANTERMRIDSSGRLLVGKTSTSGAVAGMAWIDNEYLQLVNTETGSGDRALLINRQNADGALVEFRRANTNIGSIGVENSDRLYIDSGSGNTGIRFDGAAWIPRDNGSVTDGTVDLGSSGARFKDLRLGGVAYVSDGTSSGTQTVVGGNYYIANSGAYPIVFQTNSSERMRITSGGGIGIGTSSPTGAFHLKTIRYDNYPIFQTTSDSFTPFFINFQKTDGTTIGSIRMTGTTGVAFNTTSDYRLKENVTGISDGIERVKQLNPSRFNFISDAGITVDGFLAHEAQTVVPQAVTGEKDAVDEDGNPEYQSIDHSKLVPLLTAALQEAIAKIEDLEERVATLEGN